MLLSGCWRVRSTPEVWAWNLKRQAFSFFAPSRSFASRAQMRRPARNLAISSKKLSEMSKKKVKRGRNSSGSMPRAMQSSAFCTALAEREGHRLGRRRAGLLHVLADHRHRVPARHVLAAPGDVVHQHAPRARQREPVEHVVGDVVREVVALVRGAGDLLPVDAAPLGRDQHEGEQRERRRVVHRARDLADVDAVEAALHVVGVVDDDAAGAEQLGLDRVHVEPR